MFKHWTTWLLCGVLASSQLVIAQGKSSDRAAVKVVQATCTDTEGQPEQCPETTSSLSAGVATKAGSSLKSLPTNLWRDQKELWTSPGKLRLNDMQWALPLSVFAAGVIGNDRGIESHLPDSPSLIKRSRDFSNYGVVAMVGTAAGSFALGRIAGNDKMRETGWLSGEAFINSLLVTESVKAITARQRPLVGDGRGRFLDGGDSFPSEHAAAAWSIATVVANEYPGKLSKLLAYGAATAVTAGRISGRQHFASDALIGSALGWYMGRQVYRTHSSDSDAKDSRWGTFAKSEPPLFAPEDMASPYVPLDSWVYPVLERLIATGYIDTGFLGLRPWTRMECARLLDESGLAASADAGSDRSYAEQAYKALAEEFAGELKQLDGGSNRHATMESIYTRYMGISGTPLNDSYHFGQTIVNDYGRPYAEGSNVITGASGWASAGPVAIYVRGEYQHAPASPPVSDSVRQLIANIDDNPVQPASPAVSKDKFNVIEGYAALQIKGVQVSVGKQSLWWGPGESGPLMFSNNADAIPMVRITGTSPWKLPGFLGYLGPMRFDSFLGSLQGHQYPRDPWIHAEKISFKPTPNLEFGFSRMVEFAGHGSPLDSPHPFTFRTLWRNFFDVGTGSGSEIPGAPNDPGDRRGGFDFSYRIPGLRKWLTVYNDSLTDDDPSPLSAPARSAMNPGIYLTHVPGVARLDFRAEAAYTNASATTDRGPGRFFYWNGAYHDSHTNNGNLLGGAWVGRQGRALQFVSNYWISPNESIQFSWRSASIDNTIAANGGRRSDLSVRARFRVQRDIEIAPLFQRERLEYPALFPNRSNSTACIEVSYRR